ncbi:MAG: hypothetical protein IPP49_09475 [Saprospiraceae bacterium]|nr:hypothetical protein [Saprospiraceae bacterium]
MPSVKLLNFPEYELIHQRFKTGIHILSSTLRSLLMPLAIFNRRRPLFV